MGAKLLSDVVIFLINSSKSRIDFHDKSLDMILRNLKSFYVKNILNDFWMFLKKNI